jgi:hypothetical protein
MRYFYLWCHHCPTQVIVETEAPVDAPEGQPQYCPGDGPTECPACGCVLHDWDIAGRFEPALNTNTPEVRAAWRAWHAQKTKKFIDEVRDRWYAGGKTR